MARVLVWTSAFWPLIGGVEVLGEMLVSDLAARGHEMLVVTDRPGNVDACSVHKGVPVHRFEMFETLRANRIDRWVEIRQQIAAIKREFKPDLIWVYLAQLDVMFHVKTESAYPAPTLVTMHGTLIDGLAGASSPVGDVIRSATWVTACSAHALGEARRQNPEITNRSSVIENALNMPTTKPLPLPFDPPVLLCLGRIGTKEEKGFDVAIDAMPEILRTFPGARLTIAGDGGGRIHLEQHAADAGVAGSVDFIGWVHPDRVPHLMNTATVVLMPTRVPEGFGLVALQGQQMERPVVASRVGGISEVVSDGVTGLLIEPANSAALSRAILQVLSDRSMATRMGADGRARAAREFSFARHADMYDDLLKRLVRETPTGMVSA